MKISTEILKKMGACLSGLVRFARTHGDKEIMFSECVKSESNSISDYFWFIEQQELSDCQNHDLKLIAIEFAERVLHIFESKYPQDRRPRKAIEAAKLYLSGELSLGDLRKETIGCAAAARVANSADDDAATSVCDAVDEAISAAYHIEHVASFVYAAAASAADADADDADRPWQKQRLAELMVKWGW